MKKKIFVLSPNFSKNDGISTFSRELCFALNDIVDERFDILTYDTETLSNKYKNNRIFLKLNNLKIFNKISFSILIIISTIRFNPSLIITTHAHYATLTYILKIIFSIPYIVVAHGIEIIPQMTLSKLTKFRKLALRSADHIWSVSNWTKKHLINLDIKKENIEILPNTVDGNKFVISQKKEYLLQRYSIKPNDKVILTVARINKNEAYKGHEIVIKSLPEIIKKNGPLKYLIVGKNDDKENLLELIKQHDLENQVILCGYISDEELVDHYNLSNVFLMPSYGEGFGIVFLEALSCGIPVIAGNTDGSKDALMNGLLGKLINPNNKNEIISNVSTLFNQSINRIELREKCIKNYGRDAFKKKLFDLLEKYNLFKN